MEQETGDSHICVSRMGRVKALPRRPSLTSSETKSVLCPYAGPTCMDTNDIHELHCTIKNLKIVVLPFLQPQRP